ncbi:MAG: cache domain-containing protein [Proteobacteria bacterium]|nr:cache domain-containing protein [Pseudomonadota bacterium]
MFRTLSITRLFFWSMITLALVLLVSITLAWTISEYQESQVEIEKESSNYVEHQKIRMRTFVDHAFTAIEFANAQAKTRLRASLQARTQSAVAQAQHLFETYKDSLPVADLKKMIIESLRSLRFNKGRGYYFITALDGTEMLFADMPELEGKNILSMQSSHGKYVIQDMISLVRKQGQGFYEYNWTKPGAEGNDHQKTSFVQHFAPYDWYIGTGEYMEDVQADSQKEILEHLVQIRFDQDGYLFGSIRGGDPLFTNGKVTLNGSNIMGLTDPNGVKIIEEQHKVAFANQEGGFVKYAWRKLKGEEPTPKIVFVRAFPEWDWVIGSGVYLDDIQAGLQQRQKELQMALIDRLIQVSILFLICFGIIAVISLKLSRHLGSQIDLMTRFFARSRTSNQALDTNSLTFPELRVMADSANVMLENRAEAQAAREELILELEAKNEELERFTYTASHDLKSPIITIKGFIGALRQDIESGQSEAIMLDLERIDNAAGRMSHLLDELLKLSRVGRMDNPLQDVPLGDLVAEMLEQLQGPLTESNAVITVADNLPTVRCDRIRIFEVFQNLTENALKFVTPGTRPEVEIGMRSTGGEQVFYVRDNGIGIEKQYHSKIFGLFEQLDPNPEGTGIGLALVQRIVANHNGRLWVESDGASTGTTFCFTLAPPPAS